MSALPDGEVELGQGQTVSSVEGLQPEKGQDPNELEPDAGLEEQEQGEELGKPATPEPNFLAEADSDQEMEEFPAPRESKEKGNNDKGADEDSKNEEGTEEPKISNKDAEMTELENDSTSPPATPTPMTNEEEDDGPPFKLPKLSKPEDFPTREERGDNNNHDRLTVDLDSFKDSSSSIIKRYFRRSFSNVDKVLGKKDHLNTVKISLPLPSTVSREKERDKTKDHDREREKDRGERVKDRSRAGKDFDRKNNHWEKSRSKDKDNDQNRDRDKGKHKDRTDDKDKKVRKHSSSSSTSSISSSYEKEKDRRKALKIPVILRPKKESSSADLLDTIALKLKSPKTESRPELNKPENGVKLQFQSFKIPKKKDPEKAKLVAFTSILKKVQAEFLPNDEAGEDLRGEELRKVRFTVPDGHVEDHARLIARRSMEGPKKVVLLKDVDQVKKGLNEKDMKKIELADSLFMPDAKITAYQA